MSPHIPTTLELAQASGGAPPAGSAPEWFKLAIALAAPWLLLALLLWLLTRVSSGAGGSGFVEGLGKAKAPASPGGFVEGIGAS